MKPTSRSRSLAVVAIIAALALTLVACGDDGDGALTTTVATTTSTMATTTTVAATTTSARATTTTRGGTGGAMVDVDVTVDGQPVPLQTVCRGVDGAVVAIAAMTGRRIILVREEGLALRIGTEGGTFAETTDVRTTTIGDTTRYEGTILIEGQPTTVRMEIAGESALTPC